MAGKKLVYISGPFSLGQTDENVHYAIKLANEMIDDGVVTPIVPHLNLLMGVVRPRPYDDWLAYDMEVLAHCDAVFRLPGFSAGADAETRSALADGQIVFHSKAALYTWAVDNAVAA